MGISPEQINVLIQTIGSPALILIGFYYFWTYGIQKEINKVGDRVHIEVDKVARTVDRDLSKMSRTVDGIRNDLVKHREAILDEQSKHRERLAKLDIIVERLERNQK